MVDKFANDLGWTSIQPLDGCSLGLFKILPFFLPISVFGPSPILVQLLDTCCDWARKYAYHFNGVQLVVELGKRNHFMFPPFDQLLHQ
jgi:hypothetical protein